MKVFRHLVKLVSDLRPQIVSPPADAVEVINAEEEKVDGAAEP